MYQQHIRRLACCVRFALRMEVDLRIGNSNMTHHSSRLKDTKLVFLLHRC